MCKLPSKHCFIICCFLSHCKGFRKLNRTLLLLAKHRPLSLTPKAELLLDALLIYFTVYVLCLHYLQNKQFILKLHWLHYWNMSQITKCCTISSWKGGLLQNKKVITVAMEPPGIQESECQTTLAKRRWQNFEEKPQPQNFLFSLLLICTFQNSQLP